MKTLVACLCVVCAASLALGQAAPAVKPAPPEKPAPEKAPDPKAPAVKGAAKDADKNKVPAKKEEMGKIEGTTLVRPNGNFLGLSLVQGKFKLGFYDKKLKKPMKADALRVIARWPNVHGPGNNQTILNSAGNGTYMMAPLFVRGPYSFNLTLIVVLTEGENAQTEVYTVPFRG